MPPRLRRPDHPHRWWTDSTHLSAPRRPPRLRPRPTRHCANAARGCRGRGGRTRPGICGRPCNSALQGHRASACRKRSCPRPPSHKACCPPGARAGRRGTRGRSNSRGDGRSRSSHRPRKSSAPHAPAGLGCRPFGKPCATCRPTPGSPWGSRRPCEKRRSCFRTCRIATPTRLSRYPWSSPCPAANAPRGPSGRTMSGRARGPA
mmetsp:Transcript_103200/g.315776  ORF Transcript_103200/g.315776 Transcript_103200/m.315776 type:complete len:205 (+) Transcript_103200:252-866(+)